MVTQTSLCLGGGDKKVSMACWLARLVVAELKVHWETLSQNMVESTWRRYYSWPLVYRHKEVGEVGRDRQHTETDRQENRETQRGRKGGNNIGRKALKSIITGASSFPVTSCQSENAFHFWGIGDPFLIHCVLKIGNLSRCWNTPHCNYCNRNFKLSLVRFSHFSKKIKNKNKNPQVLFVLFMSKVR